MEDIITTLILVALSTQVLPVAVGINTKKGFISFWYSFILIFTQLLFLYIGYKLGSRFLHLLENYKGIVLFVGFFMIGIRMIMDVFKIRKGDRTYFLDNTATLILASIAQGINTLLAGLLLSFMPLNFEQMIIVLAIAVFVFTVLGMILKTEKQSYAISAFFFFISALVMIISSVYLGFFI